MAKIYETREDYERDKLKSQAARLRLEASEQGATGATLIGGSFLLDLWNERMGGRGGWLGVLSTVLGLWGVVDVVRGWMTGSKAHNLELERERLGPEGIVLPADLDPHKPLALDVGRAGAIVRMTPTSVQEHAGKSPDLTKR